MADGWVSIHRQLNDHWLWKEKPFSKGQAWIDILIRVNHKPASVPIGNQIVSIEKGETIWSVLDMSLKWGWSRTKTENFLKLLEKEKQINTKKTTKYTIVSVLNWESYQIQSEEKDNKKATKGHQKNINKASKEQQESTNNNEYNDFNEFNDNNDNKEPIVIVDTRTKFEACIDEFKTFRKSIKKPMSDHAVNLLLKNLNSLANDEDTKIKILEQSIVNGWSSVYAIKDNHSYGKNNTSDTDNIFMKIGREER